MTLHHDNPWIHTWQQQVSHATDAEACYVLNAGGALEALGLDALGVRDLTGYFWGSLGFGLWLQLVRCAHLLTLSKYFE